jgi:hypothetical protein
VFNIVAEYHSPGMLPMLVNGKLRCWECRVCEGTERDGDDAGPAFDHIGYG